ncbi:TlpA family protein disulfide reductase [Bythopirellula goksoeyrii]|uniref:Thiol-disulfide oxidoreductase ResA n=1 Tax=Bythopirellula goksoeyrii TaxID=1400387 RepID=A0A5B9QD06_9BACT|nr:TlpA disulfide reductase family protein [Bythopirellula goksoeyrii]QEG36838.1 Thiol-disulfide oxidoreductase ResA [Bythopirellula goksoeyrii]
MKRHTLKNRWFTLLAAAWLMGPALCAAEQAPQLQLVNGDFLTGTLLESNTSDVLRWQSPALVDPLEFPAAAVAAAHFPEATEMAEVAGNFAVELVGGDLIICKLVTLTPEEVVIDSSSIGECRIAKNRIRRLVRWGEGAGIAYLGPHGLEGWTQQEGTWKEVAGHVLTEHRGTALLSECKIPPLACIEFEISWQHKPDFHLAIGVGENLVLESFHNLVDNFNNFAGIGGRRQATKPEPTSFPLLEFETYNSMLRILAERGKEADIALVADLNKGAGRIQFQVYVDAAKGTFAAYDMQGNLLTEIRVSPVSDPAVLEGISLTNRTGDVRLERLVVRNWNGLEPPQVQVNQEFVQKSDGSLVIADAIRFDAEDSEFLVDEKQDKPAETEIADEENNSLSTEEPEHTPLRVAVEDVVNVSFRSQENSAGGPLSLLLTSGERLTGSLDKLNKGKVTFDCLGFKVPVVVDLATVRSIVGSSRPPSKQVSDEPIGRLQSGGISCHGTVTGVTMAAETSSLSFRPQLSETSSPINPDLSGSIVFRDPPPEKPQPRDRRVQLRNRKNLAEQLVDIFTGKTTPPVAPSSPNRDEDQLLWLQDGDRIPCHLSRLDEQGIYFHASLVEKSFLPHKTIKAWEKRVGHPLPQIDAAKQARLLTLPRMQRGNPPLHLIESVQGDLLRARLLSMDDKEAIAEIRLDTKTLASSRIRRLIWLHPENLLSQDADVASDELTSETNNESTQSGAVQAVCRDGVRLTFHPHELAEADLLGTSKLLGKCRVDLRQVDQLLLGTAITDSAAELPFQSWQLTAATDPQFAQEEGAPSDAMNPGAQSPLIGQDAPDFHLKNLSGDEFRLSNKRGKIIVLDFWASWCGPCVQTMPLLETAINNMASAQVELIAVNMQEDALTVQAAIERMQISPQVLLDIDGAAAGKYAVTAIPQTVVIDADGKIASVLIGGGPAAPEQLLEVLEQVLNEEGQVIGEPAQ